MRSESAWRAVQAESYYLRLTSRCASCRSKMPRYFDDGMSERLEASFFGVKQRGCVRSAVSDLKRARERAAMPADPSRRETGTKRSNL